MINKGIIIKGNKDGLIAVIDIEKYNDFEEMLEDFIIKLSKGKKFYEGCSLKVIMNLRGIEERQLRKLSTLLINEFNIKEFIYEDKEESNSKAFTGVYEGRTKFYRKTIRSGQIIDYPGNIVIVGDINPGAEVYAAGNIVVLGTIKGVVFAGKGGNTKAIIAAFVLQPQLIQIANILTRAPEEKFKPQYPEVAKIKGDTIIVEPYLINKFKFI